MAIAQIMSTRTSAVAATSTVGPRRLSRSARLVCRADKNLGADKLGQTVTKIPGDSKGKIPLPQDRPDELRDAAIWPQAQRDIGALDSLLDREKAPAAFLVFNEINEAINGRSAMLGFLAAVIGEQLTGKSVLGQVTNATGGLAWTGTSKLFITIVVLNTIATLAPRLINNERPASRTFGPFRPSLEYWLGRTAMLGFLGLVVFEATTGITYFS